MLMHVPTSITKSRRRWVNSTSPCTGQTPLAAKRPIDRVTATALHPELVRRAEAEWATLDDAGRPDNTGGDTGGDGAAVLAELARLDPALDSAEVDALLIAEGGEA